MMNAPAGVISYLATIPTGGKIGWRGDLYKLTMLDGTVFRWTVGDVNLTSGGNTFLANCAVLRRSNIRKTSRLEIDNLQISLSALVKLSGKTIGLMSQQRAFNGARLQLDHLVGPDCPTALSFGPVAAWYEGRVAGTSLAGNEVLMTVESDIGALDRTQLPRFRFDLMCGHAVYDANCTLNKATFTDTGTASGTLTTLQVQTTAAAIIARANGYYNLGVLRFTSGLLAGQRKAVKDFTVSGGIATFALQLPFAVAPIAADAFSVYPGCPRTLAACTAFPNALGVTNNIVNFRGFPHIPAPAAAQ